MVTTDGGLNEAYPTIFDDGDNFGVSEETISRLRGIEPDDRVLNLAQAIAGGAEDLESDTVANILFALIEVEWEQADEVDRAAFIDLFGGILGRIGIQVTKGVEE